MKGELDKMRYVNDGHLHFHVSWELYGFSDRTWTRWEVMRQCDAHQGVRRAPFLHCCWSQWSFTYSTPTPNIHSLMDHDHIPAAVTVLSLGSLLTPSSQCSAFQPGRSVGWGASANEPPPPSTKIEKYVSKITHVLNIKK